MATPPTGEPVGRPTKYDPSFCDMLIEHMGKGFSFESFAATINTHRATIFRWKEKHPDFATAHKIGIDKMLLFFEKLGLAGMTGKIPGFNPTTYVWTTKNKLRWTDRVEADITQNNVHWKIEIADDGSVTKTKLTDGKEPEEGEVLELDASDVTETTS